MGTLILPPSGAVYVDANVLIYRVEQVQPYLSVSLPLWNALRTGSQQVVTSELSLLEVLVKPIQLGDAALQQLFQRILYNVKGFTCFPITRQTLETAAHLRAAAGLKTPDAIHAATALLAGCTLFVTNDPVYRRVPHLNAAILSDVVAAP